jgi:NADH-quinone oxidoreductase subunit D
MTVFLYCFREREDILRLFEMVSGQRMMTYYFRIGGLALEPPLGFFEKVNVAYLSTEDAIAMGATGPTLRGSGVDIDLRRDAPYSGYENFKFKVPVSTEGDVWARYVCRVHGSPHLSL